MQGQDFWEVVNGSKATQPVAEDVNDILCKWKIKACQAILALKTTIKEEMLEPIRDAKTPKEAYDTFATLFSKTTRLQVLENELLSIKQGDLTINQYFTKVKFLCCEISQLDQTSYIEEPRIKRIIIHGLRHEYRGFIVAVED